MRTVRKRRQRKQRGRRIRKRRQRQKGGILPLAAAIPAIIAGIAKRKAAGLGAAGAAAGFGTKKALEAMTRKRRK